MPQSCACCPQPVLEGDVERNRKTAPTVVPTPDPPRDHDIQTRREHLVFQKEEIWQWWQPRDPKSKKQKSRNLRTKMFSAFCSSSQKKNLSKSICKKHMEIFICWLTPPPPLTYGKSAAFYPLFKMIFRQF